MALIEINTDWFKPVQEAKPPKPRPAIADRPLPLPWRILVDSAEQHEWTFQNITADAAKHYRTYQIDIPLHRGESTAHYSWRALGRSPKGLGDYSIEYQLGSGQPGDEVRWLTGVGRIGIERKSVSDLQGTLLGWGDGRRERFEGELANLSGMIACVMVEGSIEVCLRTIEPRGGKSLEHLQKSLMRSILALQQDYPVRWIFMPDRRAAEVATFRWLERWWRKQVGKARAFARMAVGSTSIEDAGKSDRN